MEKRDLRRMLRDVIGSDVDRQDCDPGETIGRTHSPSSRLALQTRVPAGGKPAPTDEPPKHFTAAETRYEVIQELGRGGMGVVYQARQTRLLRDVALKSIKKEKRERDEVSRAFVSEALITGLLDHPNVVPIYDLIETSDGESAIAMKRIGGISWLELLHPETAEAIERAAEFDQDDHIEILIAVCNAVAYAHSKGIIHRDLKPSNVMVGEFGEVVVMDWGMAVVFDHNAATSELEHRAMTRSRDSITRPSGSPGYMAPEMAQAKGDWLGPWTDVYLMGAVLHEIITGRRPHDGPSLYYVVKAAFQSKPPVFADSVPLELQEICRRAMKRKVTERYQTVEEFQRALRDYLKHKESWAIARAADLTLAAFQGRSSRSRRTGRERKDPRDYAELAEALAGYRQALVLWDGNETARTKERDTRLLYARTAFEAKDYGLTLSLIERVEDPEAVALATAAREAMTHRQRSEHALKRLRVGMIAAGVVVILGLTVGFIVVSLEKGRADRSAVEAIQQAELAKTLGERAEESAEAARQNEQKALEYAKQVEVESKQRIAAMEAQQRETARADKNEARAEEKTREAEENARIAQRKAAEAEDAARRAQDAEREARKALARAEAESEAREQALEEVRRLADAQLLARFEKTATELLADPARNLIALERWLQGADDLAARLPRHHASLIALARSATEGPESLEAEDLDALQTAFGQLQTLQRPDPGLSRTTSPSAPRRAHLESRIRQLREKVLDPARYRFPSEETAWRYELLVKLVLGLDRFSHPENGTLARVRRQLQIATRGGAYATDRYAAEWTDCVRGIARSRHYRGLKIKPQRGLVPLGRDPDSELYEFLHLASHAGPLPERDPRGRLTLGTDCGLIFVLLPGGETWMGTDPRPTEPAPAHADEAPRNRVKLTPFLISKYEMTQAQWLRITRSNPSWCGPTAAFGGRQHSLRHPVESVSWEDCQRELSALALTLPTEAQWEYAARGGTDKTWFTGADPRDLVRAANLADRFHAQHLPDHAEGSTEPWDDGWAAHAPVGSFTPNPFGLHDVTGNVAEWCLDGRGGYDLPTAPETGERRAPDHTRCIVRGGSYDDLAEDARTTARDALAPTERHRTLGLRPSLALDTEAETAETWATTLEAIAKDPRYARFRLAEQPDLVPLGPDPASGLQEFLHTGSHAGPLPTRDATGHLPVTDRTGIIFVLIPGGTFRMGAQSTAENGPSYDFSAAEDEAPPHEITLTPFLLAKHEMTQGQYLRLTGSNPSLHGPRDLGGSPEDALRHPVESVSFEDCLRLKDLGLALPTEAQWEYANRAQTTTTWWTGDLAHDLRTAANLADKEFQRAISPGSRTQGWSDAHALHAPVGSFSPNPFGLHDTIGNVAEWCSDWYLPYTQPTSPKTGARPSSGALRRTLRGGSFQLTALSSRSATRASAPPDSKSPSLGLRPLKLLRD